MSITNPTISQHHSPTTGPYRSLTLLATILLAVPTPGRHIMQGADPKDTAFSCIICGKVSTSGKPLVPRKVDQVTDPGSS